MESTVNFRIKKVIKTMFAGNDSAFAERIGARQSTIATMFMRNSEIKAGMLEKIANVIPDLSMDWLISGKGDMIARVASGTDGVPLYRAEAAAGFGSSDFAIEDKDIEARYKVRELDNANFMLHVRGDSMSPNYNNGDIVAVRTIIDHRSIQWGKPHLISSRVHGLLIKRIYEDDASVIAVSDNPSYKPIYINKSDITGVASIIGCIKIESYN